MNESISRRLLAALLAAMLALGPSHAFAQDAPEAQDEGVTPTDAQQDYNDQGVILIQDGKYKQAIASFRSSLSLGELNITYLNLGRAYFRLDRCLEAREAYDAVKSAPKVKSPTAAEIGEILQRFEAEYGEACSATIAISCEGDPMVAVNDQPARSCSEVSAWPVVPGEHSVTAKYDEGEVTETLTVAARGAKPVSFATPEVVEEKPDPVVAKPAPKPQDSGTPVYVWITLGVGAALVAGGIVMDQVIIAGQFDELEDTEESLEPQDAVEARDLREDIETNQIIALTLIGAGAAALTTGAILWLVSGPDEEPAETSVSGWVAEDSGGVVLQGRF